MENSSFAKVRLESPAFDSLKGAAVTSIIFMLGLVGFFFAGYYGPEVYAKTSLILPYDSLNVTWYGCIQQLQAQNQLLFLQMRIENPTDQDTFSYIQSYYVDTRGSDDPSFESDECPYGCSDCPEQIPTGICVLVHDQVYSERHITCPTSKAWCEWTTLLTIDFVEFPTYYLEADMAEPENMTYADTGTGAGSGTHARKQMEFELVYITLEFTNFEFAIFYSLCLLMLIFMFAPKLGFFTSMWQLHKSFWSRQQMWVGALLATAFLFNNPLFALQIFTPASRAFFDLYVVFLATFFAVLLFFWLEIFGDMGRGDLQGTNARVRFERNRKKTFKEYAAKFILVSLIWLTTILVYSYVRVKQRGDPSYSSVDDLSSFTNVKVLALILALVYFTYLFINIVRAFRYITSLLPCYRFLLFISLFTVMCSVLVVFSGSLAPNQHGPVSFSFFMGLYNLYVICLAICYTPIGAEYAAPDELGDKDDQDESVGDEGERERGSLEMTASSNSVAPGARRGREFTII